MSDSLRQAGLLNINIFSIPEHTQVLAFTDDVKLYYDGIDPMFCGACGGYLWPQMDGRFRAGFQPENNNDLRYLPICRHAVKATGPTLAAALQRAIEVHTGVQERKD